MPSRIPVIHIHDEKELEEVFDALIPNPSPWDPNDPFSFLVDPNDPDVLWDHPGHPHWREED